VSGDDPGDFLATLTDTSLYSIGAHFADRFPDLVDDVIAQSVEIEETGLARYADEQGITIQSGFQTLVTGLAVRYFKAVAGGALR
jgi:hypothetical protein